MDSPRERPILTSGQKAAIGRMACYVEGRTAFLED